MKNIKEKANSTRSDQNNTIITRIKIPVKHSPALYEEGEIIVFTEQILKGTSVTFICKGRFPDFSFTPTDEYEEEEPSYVEILPILEETMFLEQIKNITGGFLIYKKFIPNIFLGNNYYSYEFSNILATKTISAKVYNSFEDSADRDLKFIFYY